MAIGGLAGGLGGGGVIGGAAVRLLLDTGAFDAGLARSKGKLASFSRGMSTVGGALTRSVSVPLAIVGGSAIKMALSFEDAFTRIDAVSNASAENIAKWRTQVLQLAGETARSPQELADALYYLASAGLKDSQVMGVLEMSAKAAAAGLGETADVARLTAQVLNAYAGSGMTAKRATDVLVAAVKEGTAAPDEFADAMGRILGVSREAGVGFDEVAASLASLSNIGLDVNEGVTAMRGVMVGLLAPTAQATDNLKKLGLSADEVRSSMAEEGILGTIRLLTEAADKHNVPLQKIIGNVRALSGVWGITSQDAAKVDASFKRVTNSTGAMNKAFRETTRGPMFEFRQAWAKTQASLIEAGVKLLPFLARAAEWAGKLADKFAAMTPEAQESALRMAGIAIAAGPLLRILGPLVGIVGRLTFGLNAMSRGAAAAQLAMAAAAGPVGSTGKAVTAAGTAAGTAGIKIGGLGTMVAGLATPLGLLAGAVALVGLKMYLAAQDTKTNEGSLATFLEKVRDGTGTMRNYVSSLDAFQKSLKGTALEGKANALAADQEAEAHRRGAAAVREKMAWTDNMVGGLKEAQRAHVEAYIKAGLFSSAMLALAGYLKNSSTPETRKNAKATQDAKWAYGGAEQKQKDLAAATRGAAGATEGATGKTRTYKNELNTIPATKATKVVQPGMSTAMYNAHVLLGYLSSIKSTYVSDIFVRTHYTTTGVPTYGRGASGLVFGAQGGATMGRGALVTRPALLVGEGNYRTPFGRGAEIASKSGVMPLSYSHLRAIGAEVAKSAFASLPPMRSGGMTLNFTFNGPVYSEEEVITKVSRGIMRRKMAMSSGASF